MFGDIPKKLLKRCVLDTFHTSLYTTLYNCSLELLYVIQNVSFNFYPIRSSILETFNCRRTDQLPITLFFILGTVQLQLWPKASLALPWKKEVKHGAFYKYLLISWTAKIAPVVYKTVYFLITSLTSFGACSQRLFLSLRLSPYTQEIR